MNLFNKISDIDIMIAKQQAEEAEREHKYAKSNLEFKINLQEKQSYWETLEEERKKKEREDAIYYSKESCFKRGENW